MSEFNVRDAVAQIGRTLDRPIVLLGLMGVGKSKLGRGIAKALDIPFYDNDQEVEQAAGCTMAEITDRFGVEAFRAAELRVCRRLIARGLGVIAVGEGVATTPEFAEIVFNETVAIWLRADIEVMIERNSRYHTRPQLRGQDVKKIIEDLVATRYPIFERAPVVVTSDDSPATYTLNQALAALADYTGTLSNARQA